MIRITLVVAAALLLAAGCSDSDGSALPPPPDTPAFTELPTFTSTIPAPTRAPITGSVAPGAVGGLEQLDGPAAGTLRLTISGMGELSSDVRGNCSPAAGGTEVSVTSADGAAVLIRLGATSSVSVKDGELDFGADLLPGDYTVAAPRLTMATEFSSAGTTQAAGRIDLDLTCG